mgnify:CR=1 FL=1
MNQLLLMKNKDSKFQITKCYAAIDKDGDVITFYKKKPKLISDGIFDGDEMFQYPSSQFPQITYENSPVQATYNGNNGDIIIK